MNAPLHPGTPAQLKRFGQMVQDAMLRLDLSAQLLAYTCGLSLEQVTGITKGERNSTVDNLTRVAACLGMDLSIDLLVRRPE